MPSTAHKLPKLDLSREYRELYNSSIRQVTLIEVPELLYTFVDGSVEAGVLPGESAVFKEGIGALYSVGYGLKFMSKSRRDDPVDFKVMPLEALWSSPSGGFVPRSDEGLDYRLLMVQPSHITRDMFDAAVAAAMQKAPSDALDEVRLTTWREGLSVQVVHVGPYSQEAATLERLEEFAAQNGYSLQGRHHEIYIGDPNRADPAKLKTILRRPVVAQ